MVRVGGGWEPLEEFLSKHDPCRGVCVCMCVLERGEEGKEKEEKEEDKEGRGKGGGGRETEGEGREREKGSGGGIGGREGEGEGKDEGKEGRGWEGRVERRVTHVLKPEIHSLSLIFPPLSCFTHQCCPQNYVRRKGAAWVDNCRLHHEETDCHCCPERCHEERS